jgi:hypothetical protein
MTSAVGRGHPRPLGWFLTASPDGALLEGWDYLVHPRSRAQSIK